MSKYNKDTKFFWLQLKEDFFDDDAIQWLEEQKPNGRDYAYFYLKLCLKSLRTNGILIRNVGEILIPYDNEKLAELTKMDFDTVVVAMDLLKNIGLVKILENGEIYMNQIEKMIGAKSIGAFKKQQQRLLRGQEADICPPEIEIKKEIDIEIEKERELKPGRAAPAAYGRYKNVILTDTELSELKAELPDKWEYYIDRLSGYIASTGRKYKNHAATIRRWAADDTAKAAPKKGIPDYSYKEGESL